MGFIINSDTFCTNQDDLSDFSSCEQQINTKLSAVCHRRIDFASPAYVMAFFSVTHAILTGVT